MNHVIIAGEEITHRLKEKFPERKILPFNPKNFPSIVISALQEPAEIIIIVSEYASALDKFIKDCSTSSHEIIRLEPEPFSHPHCVFIGLLSTVMLHMYSASYIRSTHSYATCIRKNLLTSSEFTKLLEHIHSPVAFSLSTLLLALQKGYTVKHITVNENIYEDIRYESLKEEFINSFAAFLKILEKHRPNRYKTPSITFQEDRVFKIPGKRFLKNEFITGFKKYAPFWKAHIYEDHFALLSAIYTGKEEDGIEDRVWIRILFDLIRASAKYEDKKRISRRLFPIYALYLESIHEKPIKKHIENYLRILSEEVSYFESILQESNALSIDKSSKKQKTL